MKTEALLGTAQEADSEYESDSDDEEGGKLAKPVFVAKSDRDTIVDRERLLLEEQQRWEAEKKRKEERKVRYHSRFKQCFFSKLDTLFSRCSDPVNIIFDI